MSNFPSITINEFKGMNTTRDKLSCLPFQLAYNQNYLYMTSGGLRERGGGVKLTENPNYGSVSSDPVFSLANYKNNAGSEYLITNQDGQVYYYSAGWNSLSLTLTADQKMHWENAGYLTDRAIYGVNGSNRVVKIYTSGGIPVAQLITVANGYAHDSPTDGVFPKLHKNRLFISDGKDSIYFSDILDFDHLDPNDNFKVAPGIDGFIKSLAIWGDSLFIFKEFGVYVLPNASDATTNWNVLRCDAATGTQSPDAVITTKVGIVYLASDNSIRMLNPTITFSSGEYTLGGSGTPIISHDIEDDLVEKLDPNYKVHACAVNLGDLFILAFQTNDNPDRYNDMTVFADLTKWTKYKAIQQTQPYWGFFTGFNYDYFAIQTVSGLVQLYGAKGLSGAVQETMNDGIHNDDGGAIESKACLGWLPIGGESWYKKAQHGYFVGDTENWNIEIVYQMYKMGELLPEYGEGTKITYTTTNIAGIGTVGTAVVGTAVCGQIGVGSDKQRIALKGYYFSATMQNLNADEFTRIDKLILYFRPIRQK